MNIANWQISINTQHTFQHLVYVRSCLVFVCTNRQRLSEKLEPVDARTRTSAPTRNPITGDFV